MSFKPAQPQSQTRLTLVASSDDPSTFSHTTDNPEDAREAGGAPTTRSRLALWHQRWQSRRKLERELKGQPDSVLKDAGYDRESLRRELAKPFWQG
ncbi:hypothetical protein [Roseibium polysiphoniae]|uniref:DUF1127 domain-containing protein n=1 Tax=Roseibium polysiphoniae TaxID=2571221 RepID=UPI003299A2CC